MAFTPMHLGNAASVKLDFLFTTLQARYRGLECELKAGEMLYMPCGWFHEVRSYGNSKEVGHLALNYWFHPPDNLDTSLKGMQNPYRYQCRAHQCCPAGMPWLVTVCMASGVALSQCALSAMCNPTMSTHACFSWFVRSLLL